IGGLMTSLFLTLVVVPAAYDTFDDWQENLKRRGFRGWSPPFWKKKKCEQQPDEPERDLVSNAGPDPAEAGRLRS
ncbi:MAG: hypothetical protein PHC52_11260, partial [Syntrophales bacterium]|nr:hypothetical protein [Syntrophales bacterium]